MLHYEQVLGNVVERRESKCCAVKHRLKVKGHSPNGSATKNQKS